MVTLTKDRPTTLTRSARALRAGLKEATTGLGEENYPARVGQTGMIEVPSQNAVLNGPDITAIVRDKFRPHISLCFKGGQTIYFEEPNDNATDELYTGLVDAWATIKGNSIK